MSDFTTVQSAPGQSAPENGAAQTGEEQSVPDRLLREEKKIRRWKRSELEAARAMQRIGREGLYRERGYGTIADYAEKHFGIGEARWHQMVRYAETYDILKRRLGESQPLPQNEAQSRPLQKHRGDPELLAHIWERVLERHRGQLARKRVRDVADEVTAQESDGNSDEDPKDADDAPPRGIPVEGDKFGDLQASSPWSDVSLSQMIRELEVEPELPRSSSSDGDDEGSSAPENDSSGSNTNDDDSCDDDFSDDGDGDGSRLERLRQKHPSLLEDLNDGVASGLAVIADTIAKGQSSGQEELGQEELGREELQAARKSFESLSHREPSEEDGASLPGCITGDLDTVDDKDILVAVPTELLTPGMARKAVPVGVPQMQSVVGVPLSYFDEKPPMDEILSACREQGRVPEFNTTNENVDWADYTTNPITGCLHTCIYCYARYQAETMNRYKQGFQPTFFPGRLLSFAEMEVPDEIDHPREKNVFVGSMSDIFGRWVPDWMIQAILDKAEANDDFDHLFLTKFPQKLSRFDFPDNAWIGTTVDKRHRVDVAEREFQEVDAKVKWLSCEPLLEDVAPHFDELSMFDCVVIGAQQAMGSAVEEKQPELQWVIDLYQKARKAGCKVYFKENLDLQYPKELPIE